MTAEPRRFTRPVPKPTRAAVGGREVAIRYTAASLAAPEKVRFQVMLAGDELDGVREGSGWNTCIPHIPTSIRFRVRAANNDGVWDGAGPSWPSPSSPLLADRNGFECLSPCSSCSGAR